MAFLFLLLAAAVLVLFVQLGGLQARVRRLEERLGEEAPLVVAERVAAPAAPAPAAAAQVVETAPVPGPTIATGELAPEPEPAPPRETAGALFERWVAQGLLVWLGGIALIFAAIFLIRYSIEIGLVTPAARMAGAAVLGLLCLGAGEYARRGRLFAGDPRIAQALVGAGLAILYATAYGSHILYGLLGPTGAAAAMIAVTLAALGLSLRHGAPTAIIGLVGGFLTPLLVGDPRAGAVPLLAYLALIDIAVFTLAWRRGWTWLAAAAVLMSFAWSGYLLTRPAEDALAAGSFAVLIGLAASVLRPGEGRQLGLIQPLAIAAVQLALLVARTDLGFLAWLLFGILSAASLVLALLRREYRPAPAVALGLALLLLLGKAASGLDPYAPMAAIGITLLFGGGGLALSLRRAETLWAAIGGLGLAGPLLVMRAVRPELLERPVWGGLAVLLGLVSAVLAWASRGRATAEPPASAALLFAGGAAAVLGGAAAFDLLPGDLVAAGWLAIALLAALGARRLGDLALATVAILAAVLGVVRALWMVPQLSWAVVTSLVGIPVLAGDLPSSLTAFYALGLPAVLLVALRLLLPPLPLGARRALPATAGLFVAAAFYVWFKQLFGLADGDDFVARGMIERTIVTQALFAAGWLLGSGRWRPPRMAPDAARLGGTALTVIAALRLIWFDLVVFDPVLRDQWVGALPVLNLILPAYLLSAAWLYAARRRATDMARSGPWLAAFLAALIGGVALLVRQAFHGGLLSGSELPIAEFYGYSLAGLVVAIALILAGMRLGDKALRLSGLVLLTATILKVFLVDASELKGVLRILSFLGLGVALIGIGRLYGPVVRAESKG